MNFYRLTSLLAVAALGIAVDEVSEVSRIVQPREAPALIHITAVLLVQWGGFVVLAVCGAALAMRSSITKAGMTLAVASIVHASTKFLLSSGLQSDWRAYSQALALYLVLYVVVASTCAGTYFIVKTIINLGR